jgi:hypothetical protein
MIDDTFICLDLQFAEVEEQKAWICTAAPLPFFRKGRRRDRPYCSTALSLTGKEKEIGAVLPWKNIVWRRSISIG